MPNPQLPHSCGKCHTRWAGKSTCHCGSCCQTFSSLTGFDRHRSRRGPREGTCLDPASVGLFLVDRLGYQVWSRPGDVESIARRSGRVAQVTK